MARVLLRRLCLATTLTFAGIASPAPAQEEGPAVDAGSVPTTENVPAPEKVGQKRPPGGPPERTAEYLHEGQFRFENGELVTFQQEELFQPEEGLMQPEESLSPALLQPSLDEPSISELYPEFGEQLRAGNLRAMAPSDTATALQESNEIQTVNIQRRSAISFDPRVRGYHLGQVLTYGEGIYWVPVRPDLDSMLSKVDPQLVDNINVISGPYSARFGPGFSFIDANLADTPRFDDCPQSFNRVGYDLRTNGSRQYFHDTAWGGSSDYGYIVSYGFRNGSDYLAGNGQKIPGSYNVNNVSAQLGFHLAQYTKLETRYDFMDQTKTEYPGQFFRVDRLQTNNVAFSLNDYDDPFADVRLRVDGWHNRTPMRGTVDDGGIFNIRNRVETALEDFFFNQSPSVTTTARFRGNTRGAIATSGGRLESLMGDPEYGEVRLGTDIRFLRQNIQENFVASFDPPVPQGPSPALGFLPIATQLPRSEMLNPGIYTEAALPIASFWDARAGARVDYVQTLASGLRPESNLNEDDLKQSNALYAFYLMNDIRVSDAWTANIGFGQAQRPPTLLERYADGVFVSVLQSGFTRVIGDPLLDQERLWQLDGTLSFDNGCARASLSGFQSWIIDYITFQGVAADPTGARLVRYTSTPLATLTGFEFRADADLNSSLNAYLGAHYVQGVDQTLAAPLPGISPFDSRFGLLWHSVEEGLWGLDTSLRIVDAQTRLGQIRTGSVFVTGQTTVETVTPAFSTLNVRGYWNPSDNVNFVAGVENLLNETYLEHLDLRLPRQPVRPPARDFRSAFAYAPGITPYLGINIVY